MVEPVTAFVVSTLAGLGVNFLSFISKKSKDSIKKLFSEDELEAVLKQAYEDFKDNCLKSDGTKDEKILLQVFQEFFADKKIAYEFQMVFEGKEDEVDFNQSEVME